MSDRCCRIYTATATGERAYCDRNAFDPVHTDITRPDHHNFAEVPDKYDDTPEQPLQPTCENDGANCSFSRTNCDASGAFNCQTHAESVGKHPDFHQKIYLDGKKVGRNAQEIAADVKAYQLKAGTGPHDEHMPPDQAAIRQQRQQALSGQGTPSPASPASPQSTPGQTPSQSPSSPSPQTSAVPPGTPGSGAEGPTHYDGPHALPPAMQALQPRKESR